MDQSVDSVAVPISGLSSPRHVCDAPESNHLALGMRKLESRAVTATCKGSQAKPRPERGCPGAQPTGRLCPGTADPSGHTTKVSRLPGRWCLVTDQSGSKCGQTVCLVDGEAALGQAPLTVPVLSPHLGAGSRRLFGAVLERRVCVVLDTSGSMGPHLQQVKTELVLLIWEQLRKHCDR